MEQATGSHIEQQFASTTPGGKKRKGGYRSRIVGVALWVIGVVALVIVGMVIHAHPAPWPLEVNVTKTIQGAHPVPCVYSHMPHSQLDTDADFINRFDDPIPSVAIPLAWMVVLALVRWFWQALSLGVAVLSGSTVWGGLTMLVDRPRPLPAFGICVHRVINAFSFPSGHVVHDGVMYGFLLYLSFTRPVRTWRYRWALLPLQVLAVLYLLAIGYSRLRSGEHWFFDVLGGYLTAVLWLFFLIFLYRWIVHLWAKYRERRVAKSSV
jgi:membrane-associated phospholipid phosphatase